MTNQHASDCAVHSEPAYPAGPCDCHLSIESRLDQMIKHAYQGSTEAADEIRQELVERYKAMQPAKMQPCAGRNCGSTDPNLHSAECFEDYEKATGMNRQEPVGEVLNERGEVDYISYVPTAGTLLYTTPPAQPAPLQEPPPECQTEAEKRAYAFGWWKALEANRVAPVQSAERGEPVANIRTWHKNGEQHAELWNWDKGIEGLPDGEHNLYTTPPAAPVQEPSREQTRQIVDGLQRCHHPDSQHEFLRTWVRDWTIHKTAQRQWVGLTDEEIDKTEWGPSYENPMTLAEGLQLFARAIEAKLKEKNT